MFGPVRLAFVNLVGEQKKTKAGNLKSWGAVLLFPDCADLKLLKAEATAKLKEEQQTHMLQVRVVACRVAALSRPVR